MPHSSQDTSELGERPVSDGVAAWAVLEKTMREGDEDKIKDCKEDMDALLVFAGLYSAVLTAFLIESYKGLQEDPQQHMVRLLQQIANQTSSYKLTNGSLESTIPSPAAQPPFHTAVSDLRINVCWFTSLILSLCVASFAIMVKQWLREYLAIDTTVPQERLRIRHFRHEGLASWKLFQIAAALPIFLQVSLAVFLVGLCFFTSAVDPSIGTTSVCLVSIWAALLLFAMVAPFLWNRCPYKTVFLHRAFQRSHPHILHLINSLLASCTRLSPYPDIELSLSTRGANQVDSSHIIKKCLMKYSLPTHTSSDNEENLRYTDAGDLTILNDMDASLLDDSLLSTIRMALQREIAGTDVLGFVTAAIRRRLDMRARLVYTDLPNATAGLDALSSDSRLPLIDILSDVLSRTITKSVLEQWCQLPVGTHRIQEGPQPGSSDGSQQDDARNVLGGSRGINGGNEQHVEILGQTVEEGAGQDEFAEERATYGWMDDALLLILALSPPGVPIRHSAMSVLSRLLHPSPDGQFHGCYLFASRVVAKAIDRSTTSDWQSSAFMHIASILKTLPPLTFTSIVHWSYFDNIPVGVHSDTFVQLLASATPPPPTLFALLQVAASIVHPTIKQCGMDDVKSNAGTFRREAKQLLDFIVRAIPIVETQSISNVDFTRPEQIPDGVGLDRFFMDILSTPLLITPFLECLTASSQLLSIRLRVSEDLLFGPLSRIHVTHNTTPAQQIKVISTCADYFQAALEFSTPFDRTTILRLCLLVAVFPMYASTDPEVIGQWQRLFINMAQCIHATAPVSEPAKHPTETVTHNAEDQGVRVSSPTPMEDREEDDEILYNLLQLIDGDDQDGMRPFRIGRPVADPSQDVTGIDYDENDETNRYSRWASQFDVSTSFCPDAIIQVLRDLTGRHLDHLERKFWRVRRLEDRAMRLGSLDA